MDSINGLIKVDWKNSRVLTTKQLAQAYECTADNISINFNNHKNHFVEGEHYFKLTGATLRQFKRQMNGDILSDIAWPVTAPDDNQPNIIRSATPFISPNAAVVYLWTEAGCLYHCKLLNTEKAWQVFGELVRLYFEVQEQLTAPPVARKAPSDMACVYAFDTDKNLVKIGHTGDIPDRVKRVQRQYGLKVTREHHTDFMPRDKARDIEMRMHRRFSEHKVDGEFYDAQFAEVVDVLDKCIETFEINYFEEETETISDFERGKELVKLIAVAQDSPLREELIRQSANLLLGRQLY